MVTVIRTSTLFHTKVLNHEARCKVVCRENKFNKSEDERELGPAISSCYWIIPISNLQIMSGHFTS